MTQDAKRRRPHGWQDYAAGHRCRVCRKAWADYHRERKHRLGLVRPRDEQRFYDPPYGRRGLTALGETILDTEVARTGRDWRDVMDRLLRQHGAAVTFPEASATTH